MRNIFFDKNLQQEFNRNGYVIVTLLNSEQILGLIDLYDSIEGAKGTANTNKNTYELSFFDKNIDAKRYKFNVIYDYMRAHIDKVLDNYSPIMINLFNKEYGTGEVPIHQNWTFVDEKEYTSVSLWCPLQPVDKKNGTLEVVAGTHKVIADYRGPSIPWVFDELNAIMKEKYMSPLVLKPGQVAILDDSIIHYSGDNYTHENRKAVQFILKPQEVSTIHCFKEDREGDSVQVMEVEDGYFFDFDMWSKPRIGKNLRTVHFPSRKISEEELVRLSNHNLLSQ